ncbi:MAG: helicase-related protein [Candidatus Aminicenantes bacterium]|nr:helicase-related protein [Candidatus Aminicenantes bacterium]
MCNVCWGDEIGYQTGLDSNKSPQTALLYLTDGVQMVQEIQGKREYDVLILDEIHEWNLNQEVLVGLVKKNLDSGYYQRSGKRVVIMSATLKARQISAFLNHAPVITIPGRGFPVVCQRRHPCFFLPDAANLLESGHNILIFQPGKQEIEETMQNLKELLEHDKQQAVILPLHSELSINEQGKVFKNYPLPKAVVATDIAQTSLTIDDIDAVIDSGVKKEVRLVSGIEGLYPTEISTSECRQRAGRAGRVKKGVYILCSERGMEERSDYPEPEIRRLNLESVVLRMYKWGLTPLEFNFFHRPNRSLILKAIQNLKNFGALSPENKVTTDGRRMAELPLSVRSARLLLEAEKGGARVVDRALKAIAIFETRGIVNKEFSGGGYSRSPFKSDLLNQLEIWEDEKANARLISRKKTALASEIYNELRKRLAQPVPRRGPWNESDQKHLFRAILSAFCDGVYFRGDGIYWREKEERQLERTSILNEAKPEMVAALPFDLIINREDQKTGNKEEKYIPLLTFASELSLKQLDELSPFSYEKRRAIVLKEDKISVDEQIFFGGRMIKTVAAAPDWTSPDEKHTLLTLALQWFADNSQWLPCRGEIEKNRAWFKEAAAVLGEKLPPFDHVLREFLYRQLRRSLKIDDLRFFFQFHPALRRITLNHLLPYVWLKKLKAVRWPGLLKIKDMELPMTYIGPKSYLTLGYEHFHRVEKDEIILPSGEEPGFLLQGLRFENWAAAVSHYNTYLKNDIFGRKWRNDKKSIEIGDAADLPFPMPFQGGNGKDNTPFEFYSVPTIENGQVFLIHFPTLEEANAHFLPLAGQWQELKSRFKKAALDNVFRTKGWTIK